MFRGIRNRVRLLVLITVAIFIGIYHYLFQTERVENYLKETVNSSGRVRLELKLTRSSPLFGFEAKEVALINLNDKTELFRAERVRISYFLPSFIIGHVGLRNLTLDKPEIYLSRHGERWNIESLFSSEESTTQSYSSATSTPQSVDEEPLPERIITYLPLKLYGGVKINQLGLHIKQNGSRQNSELKLENINLRLSFVTKTFFWIDLNEKIFNLFDTLMVSINPLSPIKVYYKNRVTTSGDLVLSQLLYRDSETVKTGFLSEMLLDSSQLYNRQPGRAPESMGVSLTYQMIYDARKDLLQLKQLSLLHHRQNWLSLQADIEEFSTHERIFNIRFNKSEFNLSRIDQLLRTNLSLKHNPLGGKLSVANLTLTGKTEKLNIEGEMRTGELFFPLPDIPKNNIRNANLHFNLSMDCYRILPFLKKPPDYTPTQETLFGFIHKIEKMNFGGDYNRGRTIIRGTALPRDGLDLNIELENFTIAPFTQASATGHVNASIQLNSDESFNNIKFKNALALPDFQFLSSRSRSEKLRILLNSTGYLKSSSDLFSMRLTNVLTDLKDSSGRQLATIKGGLLMEFGEKIDNYFIEFHNARLFYGNLHLALPGNLQHTIQDYADYLRGETELVGRISFSDNFNTNGFDLSLKMPFFNNEELKLKTRYTMTDKLLKLDHLELQGMEGGLNLTSSGKYYYQPDDGRWHGHFDTALEVKTAEYREIYNGIFLKGDIKFKSKIRNHLLDGEIKIADTNFEMRNGNCQNSAPGSCNLLRLNSLNLKLPFSHQIYPKQHYKILNRKSKTTFGNHGIRSNFSIDYISSSHNPRNEYKPHNFFYTGSTQKDDPPGLSATVEYRNNILFVNNLQINCLRPDPDRNDLSFIKTGTIYGKKIFFNLSNLEPGNMEYSSFIQFKDLDLEPYLPGSRSGYDGIISGDIHLSGSSLVDPIHNTNATISVYRLSPEFSGFATRVIMPNQIAEGIMNRTFDIPSIKLQLTGGLVYTALELKREALGLGLLIRPSSELIKQERIPLAQFMAQARSEFR